MRFSQENLKQRYLQLRNTLKYISLRHQKTKEIKDIYAQNPQLKKTNLNKDLKERTRLFWKKYGLRVNTLWHRAYISINGIEDHRYIPEDIFYSFIEPSINRKDIYLAYIDKNNYEKLFKGIKMPKTIIRNINSKYYDENYEKVIANSVFETLEKHPGEYIVKPSIRSGGGWNVLKIKSDSGKILMDGKPITPKTLENLIHRDFLIQEYLIQHPVLNRIYPCSVNTLRMITFRKNAHINVLRVYVKFGNQGSFVDNTSQGGSTCGIQNNGEFSRFAVSKDFQKIDVHPYTGIAFKNTIIPNFPSVLNFVINLHQKLYYFDMASWDIAIDAAGEPVLIELNLIYQGIIDAQIYHGPLFGDSTDEILERAFAKLKY